MNKTIKVLLGQLSIGLLILPLMAHGSSGIDVKHQGTSHDALYDICFHGKTGLAVGSHGLIVQSVDGGEQWASVNSGSIDRSLFGISCGSQGSLVVGQEGVAYSLNEGELKKLETGTDQRLLSVAMNKSGLAFAVGGFGTVLRSTDHGSNWQLLAINWEQILNDYLEPHIYDVSVDESGVVTLVGEFELVLQSTDGGESWVTRHMGDASLFALDLRSSGNGFAVGQNGRVLKTSDGGSSWGEVNVETTSNLLGVWSSDRGELVISGIRTMLMSSDGGVNISTVDSRDVNLGWYQAIAGIDEDFDSDQATDSTTRYYSIGHSGRIIQLAEPNTQVTYNTNTIK